MEIKFQLPNPDEVNAEQFFVLMRTTLKAVEKSYQEMIKDLSDEDDKPWMRFRHSDDIEGNCESCVTDFSDSVQEIYLAVNTL